MSLVSKTLGESVVFPQQHQQHCHSCCSYWNWEPPPGPCFHSVCSSTLLHNEPLPPNLIQATSYLKEQAGLSECCICPSIEKNSFGKHLWKITTVLTETWARAFQPESNNTLSICNNFCFVFQREKGGGPKERKGKDHRKHRGEEGKLRGLSV